ncbi:MAG: hypothetical protein WBP71_17415 [Terracidiphilus sp.]
MQSPAKHFAILAVLFAFSMCAGCGGSSSSTTSPPPPPPPPVINGEWRWVSGLSTDNNAAGVYGTQGVASPNNVPGGRAKAASWEDAAGNLWLFGGIGFDSTGNLDRLGDMWKYSNGEWTWISGSTMAGQPGIYGTKGTPTSGNVPGAHAYSVTWTDANGNFWLFGGDGVDSVGTRGLMNDLWEYTNGVWTWVSGSNVAAQPGIAGAWQGTGAYGTKGVADPSNVPGARWWSSAWADQAGNLWLFGGAGVDSTGKLGLLNDLWKYSNGMWTWMAGSDLANEFGTYGTQGTAAPGNTPGGRTGASAWIDAQGNLWLFGGDGGDDATVGECDKLPEPCILNDLWKYSNGEWTWVGGSNVIDAPGVYGTQGVPAVGNWPPPRSDATAWTDAAGNFWLFGGSPVDALDMNDLWKYSNGEWTWVGGSNQECEPGGYGTDGTFSSSNIPGAREGAPGWVDKSGDLWVFGGTASCPGQNTAWKFNDLWEYQP